MTDDDEVIISTLIIIIYKEGLYELETGLKEKKDIPQNKKMSRR